ncbi:peptide chain release factor 2 [Candidatus Sumerlaeota bacterium]|nr:peptide chain release factor 2 [Candidatus Sumerlaeota bacterium]
MTLQETSQKLSELKARIAQAGDYLNLAAKEAELKELEEKTAGDGFWNDMEEAQQTLKKIKQLKAVTEPWRKCEHHAEDTLAMIELLDEEGEDSEMLAEAAAGAEQLDRQIEKLETASLLSGETDLSNCYLYINAGAGGTESCDWASMLMRMYVRFGERSGYAVKALDIQPGDEAGIKSCQLFFEGDFAYGYLKAESGVHRLVRISPFDANKRRHTSFASVHVTPELDDTIEVEIDEKDLRIDYYRASGAGGQHVNKTSSAVRITHHPSGVVVACQNERSQHQNKDVAFRILRSRLYALEVQKRREAAEAREPEKKEIGWGSQIRSYVFQPYQMVKDVRTSCQTGNLQAVMDGDIDEFIESYLRWSVER